VCSTITDWFDINAWRSCAIANIIAQVQEEAFNNYGCPCRFAVTSTAHAVYVEYKSSELRIKPSRISAFLTNCRDTCIPPISGLPLLHVLNEEVQGCTQGSHEPEAPVFSGYFTILRRHITISYSNLPPIHLAQRHADLCVRILRSTHPKCIGQWMRDRSGNLCERMIGLGIILGLHVKALLLRRRFRKQKARASHSYKQALFYPRTAAREGQEISVRLIWYCKIKSAIAVRVNHKTKRRKQNDGP
jgi:hypothetical protein